MLTLSSDWGILKVSGIQAKVFLQGQVTCHLEEITALQGSLGAHCNPQGRVISLFNLFLFQDAYYLLMSRDMVMLTLNALKKYAVFYQVALTDVSDTFTALGSQGIATIPLWPQLADSEVWKCQNICKGIPAIYPATSGKFLPHELNLHELRAIHFDKGCYTGQEIIARMHYRGKLKNHLYQASVSYSTSIQPGALLYTRANQVSGTVVDACQDAENHYRLLLVTDEANAKNQHLFLESLDSHDPVGLTIL